MYDKITRKARGFGFVTLDSQEATDEVLKKSFHFLKGTKVETKNVEPRDQNRCCHDLVFWSPRVIRALLMAVVECTHRTTCHFTIFLFYYMSITL